MGLSDFIARRRWLPAVSWACLIMIASSLPTSLVKPKLFPGCDKVAHFVEYLVLGVAIRYWTVDFNMLAVTGGIGFGIIDEFHQFFIPGRNASLMDLGADVVGFCVGYLWVRQRSRNGRKD